MGKSAVCVSVDSCPFAPPLPEAFRFISMVLSHRGAAVPEVERSLWKGEFGRVLFV